MKALKEFYRDVTGIYAYGLLVSQALILLHDHFGKMLSFSSQTKNSELVFFHTGNPNHPEATYQYRKDFGTLLDASAKNGKISVTHRRSIMTLLHSAWEDRYRKMIANEIGLKCKNDLKSDVFQDVDIYRQAVIHAGGKLGKEPKVFRFFGKGEEVSLTSDHIVLIFGRVVDELNRLGGSTMTGTRSSSLTAH